MSLAGKTLGLFLHQIKNQSTMIEKEVVQGDTFPVVYKHMENGVLADLPEGYDVMIGLRKENSTAVTTFSYQNGDISNPETGVYRWKISHEPRLNHFCNYTCQIVGRCPVLLRESYRAVR